MHYMCMYMYALNGDNHEFYKLNIVYVLHHLYRASLEQETNQKSFDFGPIFVFKYYELIIKVQPWLVSLKSKATDVA